MKKEEKSLVPNEESLIATHALETHAEEITPALKKIDRIVIGEMAGHRIHAWIKQVEASRPGVEITKRNLMEWLILSHSEALLPSEVKELAESHYNELRFLQFAVRELKAAKERGEKVSLHDVVGSLPLTQKNKYSSQRAPRKTKVSEEVVIAPGASSVDELPHSQEEGSK